MYAQCDPERNQYVFLDDILDFRKTNSALSIEDKNIIVKVRVSLRCLLLDGKYAANGKTGRHIGEILVT